ncbi:MAG: PEGA domain-containing protein, partial [Nannocystaceae bacterium]|nr:PEGA domain-containing protein [Nannocystaceae bacterium]
LSTTQSPPRTPEAEDGEGLPLQSPFTVGRATLRLGTNAGSAPAQVSVDGEPVGKTPIPSLKVSPGKHTVVFQWGSKTRSFTLDVEANEVRVVRADDK